MIQDFQADRTIMINEKTRAEKTHADTSAPQTSGREAGRPRQSMTKVVFAVLLIVNSLILVVIPYVLRRSSEVSNEAILLIGVAGYAVFGIALVFWFRWQAQEDG